MTPTKAVLVWTKQTDTSFGWSANEQMQVSFAFKKLIFLSILFQDVRDKVDRKKESLFSRSSPLPPSQKNNIRSFLFCLSYPLRSLGGKKKKKRKEKHEKFEWAQLKQEEPVCSALLCSALLYSAKSGGHTSTFFLVRVRSLGFPPPSLLVESSSPFPPLPLLLKNLNFYLSVKPWLNSFFHGWGWDSG